MTRVIHTCACTHTSLTQTPNTESRMRQTEAMAVSLNLTNLSHWLPRGISSFNNRERKRQRYQKGKKKTCINIQFHTNLLLLPNKCWDDNSFIPFWKKNKNRNKKPQRHIQSNHLYIHLKLVWTDNMIQETSLIESIELTCSTEWKLVQHRNLTNQTLVSRAIVDFQAYCPNTSESLYCPLADQHAKTWIVASWLWEPKVCTPNVRQNIT